MHMKIKEMTSILFIEADNVINATALSGLTNA